MKFYRVSRSSYGSSYGFEYHATKKEALARKREWESDIGIDDALAKIEVIDIEPTKRGILDALRKLASHPDNG